MALIAMHYFCALWFCKFIYRQRFNSRVTWYVIHREAQRKHSLAAAKVFGVSPLCYELPCGFVGEIYGGKCQSSSFLQDLSSDENILSYLGSAHVSARHQHCFQPFVVNEVNLQPDLLNTVKARITHHNSLNIILFLRQTHAKVFSGVPW